MALNLPLKKILTGPSIPREHTAVVYAENGHVYARDEKGSIICQDSRTACIEEAVNYVGSLGGGKVYIRRGTYRISKFIRVLADNVEIYGDGMGRTVIENMDINSPAIYVGDDNKTSIIVRNVYIHDLTIDAKYQYDPNNPKGNGNSTLWAYYVSDLMLERIEHKNAYWRTMISPGSGGCQGKCIQENVVVRQNVFMGVALTLGGIRNLVLEDNIWIGAASSPDFNSILDFSYGEYQDSYIYNATVKGNIFYKVHRHPYNREGWLGAVVGFIRVVGASWVGNIFIDPDHIAIHVQDVTAPGTTLDVRGLEFIGNVIIGEGKTNKGIVANQKNVVIKGNYIENVNDIAIPITNSEAVIEGNYILNTPTAGIWVSNSRATIIGNILKECAVSRDKCIVVDGTSAYCSIVGNRIYRSNSAYLPYAIDTAVSGGYNTIVGNVAEGYFNTTKYRGANTDVITGNV
jgi:hypothetical protein